MQRKQINNDDYGNNNRKKTQHSPNELLSEYGEGHGRQPEAGAGDDAKPISTAPLADIPMDEEFADMDKDVYTPEEAYEMTMKDIKAIYDDAAV